MQMQIGTVQYIQAVGSTSRATQIIIVQLFRCASTSRQIETTAQDNDNTV